MIKFENGLIDLGKQPISNNFQALNESTSARFPMKFGWRDDIGCMTLKSVFPTEQLKPKFDWISYYEPEDHLDDLVSHLEELLRSDRNKKIIGYSFKDETTLKRFNERGFTRTTLIDPKNDLGINDKVFSVETIQDTLSRNTAKNVLERWGKSDLIIARHVIEHAYDVHEQVRALKMLCRDQGYIMFEIPDSERAMSAGDCTILWEEHINYFTENSFRKLMDFHGLTVIGERVYPYSLENSIVFIVQPGLKKISESTNSVDEYELFHKFAKTLVKKREKIVSFLSNLKKEGKTITVFGAGHLSCAFIAYNDVNHLIDFVIDDNPSKSGMRMPVGNLPIKHSDVLNDEYRITCLLGANPQHHKIIRKKFANFLNMGGEMFSIFPDTENYLNI